MAPARRSRAGLGAGALSLALLAGLAVYPAASTGGAGPLVLLPGLLALALLATAFALRMAALVPWALLPFLAQYTTFLLLEGEDRLAPAVAAGLVLVAELAHWALEPRHVGRGRALAVRRAVTLLLLTGLAAGTAAFLLGAAQLAHGGGVALEALGVTAAVLALAVVAWLARERRGAGSDPAR